MTKKKALLSDGLAGPLGYGDMAPGNKLALMR
jgi:hypothetical protein